MKHEKIKKLVSEYIDGELKKNIELVKEHLKSCDECSQLVRVHNLVREVMSEGVVEVSPYVFTKVQARIRERKMRQGVWDYVIGFACEVAIALVLIFLLLLGLELISRGTQVKIEEAVLGDTPSIQKVMSSGGELTKDEVLELTLTTNGDRKK
jgi:predicted anti-sigma-YlaC factor YlaD